MLKQRNSPFVWLYEITLEYSTVRWKKLYATSHDVELTWQSQTFKPWNIGHRDIAADSAGSLPSMEMFATNVTREIGAYAWATRGFAGLPMTVHALSKNALGSGDSILTLPLTATSCAIDGPLVLVRLGAPPWLEYEVPAIAYVRNQCGHIYKDPETCRYRGSIPDCDLSLFGVNGCVVHGQDAVANGRPNMWPRLYGGQPAIPQIPV